MTTAPAEDDGGRPLFAAVDDETFDLLHVVADVTDPLPVRASDVEAFLGACEADATTHGGVVSVNRVRARLAAADVTIPAKRYASFWSHFTGGPAQPMRVATTRDVPEPWEVCQGATSRNDGRPYRLRIWTGFRDPASDPRRSK